MIQSGSWRPEGPSGGAEAETISVLTGFEPVGETLNSRVQKTDVLRRRTWRSGPSGEHQNHSPSRRLRPLHKKALDQEHPSPIRWQARPTFRSSFTIFRTASRRPRPRWSKRQSCCSGRRCLMQKMNPEGGEDHSGTLHTHPPTPPPRTDRSGSPPAPAEPAPVCFGRGSSAAGSSVWGLPPQRPPPSAVSLATARSQSRKLKQTTRTLEL